MHVMATASGTGEPLEPLTYKTWVLKVSIHCQGCKRKVNKVLHGIEGVYTINIDIKQQKVVVTGNVEADTLIRKLIKSGKHAELWPNPVPEPKEKKSKKSKKKCKENEGDSTSEEEDDDEDDDNQNDQNAPDVEKHPVKIEVIPDPTGKIPGVGIMMVTGGSGNQPPVMEKKEGENVGGAEKSGSGNKRKKKKKKGNKTVTIAESSGGGGGPTSTIPQDHHPGPPQINLGPPSNYGYHQFPSHYHLPMQSPMPMPTPTPVYAVNYNTNNPTTGYKMTYYATPQTPSYSTDISHNNATYCASPPRYSYGHAYYGREVESPPSDSEYYSRKSSDSLELFSEENPNGCLIM